MKRSESLLAGFLLAMALMPAVAAASVRIDTVTIFPNQLARIERVAEFPVEAGSSAFVFEGLPAAIQTDSIRVAVQGKLLRIGAIQVTRKPVGASQRDQVRKLNNQIEQLKRERQAALDRAAAAQAQITFIEGLARLPQQKGAAQALLGDGNEAASWPALWQRIGEGARQAHQRLRAARHKAAELKEQINTLQQRLNQLGDRRHRVVQVRVPYKASAVGTARLRLIYRVEGPSWQPRYAARLNTTHDQITLVRSAQVRQATGVDWHNVQLRLATVPPVRGKPASLNPWWISLAQQVTAMAQSAKLASPAPARMLSMATDAAAKPVRTLHAEFAATYVVPGRVSIPSGNQPHQLRIGTRTLDARVGARVVPQRSTRVWLTATTTWQGDAPLPAGELARFRDGTYVGTTHLATWAPGEQRKLSFGVDRNIEVHFKPVRRESGKSGWITTESTRVRSYSLTLTNHHDQPMKVTTVFRVPVPRNEAIDVLPRFSQEPDRHRIDHRPGVHAWDFKLAAGESVQLKLGYKVTWPVKRELSGL